MFQINISGESIDPQFVGKLERGVSRLVEEMVKDNDDETIKTNMQFNPNMYRRN